MWIKKLTKDWPFLPLPPFFSLPAHFKGNHFHTRLPLSIHNDSPNTGAEIGLRPSRRECLRKPSAVLWIEVQGDGFIRRLQGYYCPNKHLLCQTWSTAAAQRPLNFIWFSISLSFLPLLLHCSQTWIAYCSGLLHFFHLTRLHQADSWLPAHDASPHFI